MHRESKMFYKEETINDNLKCQICHKKYVSPSMLPCGDSICQHHLTKVISILPSDSKEFKCPLCLEVHDLPKNNSFPENKMILRMIKQKPTEVIQSNLVREFKNDLKKYNEEVKYFEKMITNNGADFVYDHCQKLRTEVHLAVEYRIQDIRKLSDEMIAKINKFEAERIKFLGI